MKRLLGRKEENVFEVFGFEVLSTNEMLKVRGGTDPKPKIKDTDVFDLEDE